MKLTQNIRLKGQRSHRLFKVFIMSAAWLCAYLTNSLHILHKYNPRDDDVPHTPFPGQKAEDQDHTGCSKLRSRVVLSFCHVCSVACCLFDRFVLYVVQIQPMKSWCVTHHFHFKGSKVQVTQARWKFWPYLPANFTDWYVAQKQVIRTISRSKGRWSKSYGLLEVFVMSAPWLFDRFTSYEAQIKPMEGRCITHHFQVKRSRSHVCSVPICPIHLI